MKLYNLFVEESKQVFPRLIGLASKSWCGIELRNDFARGSPIFELCLPMPAGEVHEGEVLDRIWKEAYSDKKSKMGRDCLGADATILTLTSGGERYAVHRLQLRQS